MEIWKDINGFPGYQVSNEGRVRTFFRKKHYPSGYGTYRYISEESTIMKQSDDGNGYMKLMLYSQKDGRRYCKKVHRLVAEAFIPHNPCDDTVDHIQSGSDGKRNNHVENLRWIPREDNIRKAYRDGMCNKRIETQRKPVVATDLWSGGTLYFKSISEAAKILRIDNSSISHNLNGDCEKAGHYVFEYAGWEDILLYGGDN